MSSLTKSLRIIEVQNVNSVAANIIVPNFESTKNGYLLDGYQYQSSNGKLLSDVKFAYVNIDGFKLIESFILFSPNSKFKYLEFYFTNYNLTFERENKGVENKEGKEGSHLN